MCTNKIYMVFKTCSVNLPLEFICNVLNVISEVDKRKRKDSTLLRSTYIQNRWERKMEFNRL